MLPTQALVQPLFKIGAKPYLLPPRLLHPPPLPHLHQSWRSHQAGCTHGSLAVDEKQNISLWAHTPPSCLSVLLSAPAHLVRVLQDQVLALVQLEADVDDAAQDSPGVLHAQVDLAGEFIGFELLGAQDDVASRVFHVVPRNVPGETTEWCRDSQSSLLPWPMSTARRNWIAPQSMIGEKPFSAS